MKKNFKTTLLILSACSLVLMMGCRKKKDTVAIITCKSFVVSPDSPVENAKVVLYGKSTTGHQAAVTVHDTVYTNSSGQARFVFNDEYQLGQAGVFVLDIKATKDNLSGTGVIKVVEEETTHQGVVLQ